MKIVFVHPRYDTTVALDASDTSTGRELLERLVAAGFLDAGASSFPYVLVHRASRREIRPGTTLGEIGARDGDQVDVSWRGRCCCGPGRPPHAPESEVSGP